MYNKINIEAGKVASKSSIKPELACVAFYGNKTIATDSFRLLEISAVGDDQEAMTDPILYNYKQLKALKIKKNERINNCDISEKIQPTTGEYPEASRIIKEAEDNESINVIVNAEYLQEMLSILKQINTQKDVTLHIPKEDNKPILLTADGKDQTAKGLLMPKMK